MEDLIKDSLLETKRKLDSGDVSSVELTNAYIKRIENIEPKVNSFISCDFDLAIREARLADDLRRTGSRGPLLGIPYSIKDLFSTKDILTTAGSNILKNYIPPYDSTVYKKLKEAGAVLLGKNNLDAFAHGSSTEASDFKVTSNPWDYGRLPGGSSGGSAAAVAARESVFSIGSDTGGSVRQPASWCGVTGLRPTYGRISRYGLIAMASSFDCPGILARDAKDTAYLLSLLAGKDELDATSSFESVPNYLQEISGNVTGVRIGIIENYFIEEMDKEMVKMVEEATEIIQSLGATVGEVNLLDPKLSVATYTVLQRSEVASNLERFDGVRFGEGRDVFGSEAKKRIMLGNYGLSSGYFEEYYLNAQKVRTLIINDFKKAFNKFDILVCPTTPTTALPIGAREKNEALFGELMDILNEPCSIAGIPALTVPCGLLNGLPVGLQLIGPSFSEDLLLRVANKYQESTGWHKMFPDLN